MEWIVEAMECKDHKIIEPLTNYKMIPQVMESLLMLVENITLPEI